MKSYHFEQLRHIRDIGWTVVGVFPTEDCPGSTFTYTAGLTAIDQPELIVSGLDVEIAHMMLNYLAGRVHRGEARLMHGDKIGDLLVGYDTIIIGRAPTEELYPGTAFEFYGDKVRLQQIVWPDKGGKFPWDSGYMYGPEVQPILGKP